jgi:hypothetical protein
VIKVLQTFALPLGHDAMLTSIVDGIFTRDRRSKLLKVLQTFAPVFFTGYHLATTPYHYI